MAAGACIYWQTFLELRQVGWLQVLRRLDNVDEKVIEFFAPAAKLVLERGDKHDAMCRALAALSGLIEVPKPRRWAAQQSML